MERRWVFPLVITSLVCTFFLATFFNMRLLSSLHSIYSLFLDFPSRITIYQNEPCFVEQKIAGAPPLPTPPSTPKFAYLISGSKGDLEKLWRVLLSLYHPWNYYLLHLDLESPAAERLELVARVQRTPLFAEVGNVLTNNKSNMVTYTGPTMVSNTLHACAILLKRFDDWDWFINLSASDYPLVTQDGGISIFQIPVSWSVSLSCHLMVSFLADLLHTFSSLKPELNFIQHTSHLGWKA